MVWLMNINIHRIYFLALPEWAFVHDDENLFHDTSKLNDICFYCTASVKQSQLNREISIMDNSKKEFTSRHSLEWNILFLDRR